MAPDQPQIPAMIRRQLDWAADEHRLYLAAFSLAEVAYLCARKRIDLSVPLQDWFDLSLREPLIQILPLTTKVAVTSSTLPDNFHGDPGDRLIAATAKTHNLVLCTRDRALLRFGKQGIYKLLEV